MPVCFSGGRCLGMSACGTFQTSRHVRIMVANEGKRTLLGQAKIDVNDLQRHWPCTAAMVLVSISAPIKVLV